MERIYDTIIVGSGPAGLTAAIYGQRAGLSLLVIESSFVKGGQIQNTYEVDNYPGLSGISGQELSEKFYEHAAGSGAEFVKEKIIRITQEDQIFCLHGKKQQFKGKSIILACGADHRKLQVPGEEELSGMGVSYCATCDGAFFKDRVTAVIGGGDTAAEDALFLARGCEKVYLIHRRDELRAAKTLQEKLMKTENIQICFDRVAEEIKGEDQVAGLRLKNKMTQSREELPVDGVFVAVGTIPNTEFLEGFIQRDENGYILAGEDTKTSRPGIFAAGDVRTKKLRQIITAAADGANAVSAVQEYLNQL